MKNLTKLFAITVVFLGVYSNSFAQTDPKSATGKATAEISATGGAGSTMVWNQDLQFGTITRPSTGSGVITVAPSNATTAADLTNGVTTGVVQAASFTFNSISGTYNLTTPAFPDRVLCQEATHETEFMALSAATTNFDTEGKSITKAAGDVTIYVGSSLTVASTQTPGQYKSADFTVTVALP